MDKKNRIMKINGVREVLALACAAIDRLGSESPANQVSPRIAIWFMKSSNSCDRFESRALETVEALNTRNNRWVPMPPMPTARQGVAVAVVDDRFIWTFGDVNASQRKVNVIEVFDVERNEWSTPKARMPSRCTGAVAVAIGHKVFIIGGARYEELRSTNVEIIDTETKTWEIAPQLTAPLTGHAAIGLW